MRLGGRIGPRRWQGRAKPSIACPTPRLPPVDAEFRFLGGLADSQRCWFGYGFGHLLGCHERKAFQLQGIAFEKLVLILPMQLLRILVEGSVVIQLETSRLLVDCNFLGHKAIDYMGIFINGLLTARRPDRHFEPCSSLA